MALTRYRLGDLLERLDNVNADGIYGVENVRGVNNLKKMMATKANLAGRDLRKFSIVYPNEFVFNHRTSRNGSKFSITINYEDIPYIFTEDYVVFRVREDCNHILESYWLYLNFCRSEFDRYVIMNSWGSSTEFYNWEDVCSIDIDLPPIDIQQKYVDVYRSMVANQHSYERGLDDLKLVCDGYIENLRTSMPCEPIGQYIEQSDRRNDIGLGVDAVRGLSTMKQITDTKASLKGVSLTGYKLVLPNSIAFVPDTSRRGDKISLALNGTGETILVSSISCVFSTDASHLLPEYLMLFFSRSEFDRYARFHSWGSARETFMWDDMCNVRIPIPDLSVQQSIVDIYNCYLKRREINERLKAQIRDICPILIRGSLLEGSR